GALGARRPVIRMSRLVDLSHPIEAGVITYPGLPAPEGHAVLDPAASTIPYAPGGALQIDLLTLCGHTGTSPDRPLPRHAEGAAPRPLPLERLAALPVLRIDATGTGRAIDAPALEPFDLGGRAVLLHTGFDRFWRTDAYLRDNPFLTRAAVQQLVERGA